MKTIKLIALSLLVILLSSCATIRPGEIGMKQSLGKLKPKVYNDGIVGFNPFVTQIIKLPTRTINLEVKLNLPSKDGLNVNSEISILYRINGPMASKVITDVGLNYEDVLILSVFRSASADVASRFNAKDMYTAGRGDIERDIQERMNSILTERGFIIENVLLKSIRLPQGLSRAIEDKLEAEQLAQRMEFELQREEMEAKRKIIEAEGIKDAQKIIQSGLSPEIIQWQSIEAFRELSSSPGTRLIITDGKAPFLIEGGGGGDD
jgi:regulator of protease activity HflC (stomatin/prohibitin superfamily)